MSISVVLDRISNLGLSLFYLQDPKRHLEEDVDKLMADNVMQCLGAMLHTVSFK